MLQTKKRKVQGSISKIPLSILCIILSYLPTKSKLGCSLICKEFWKAVCSKFSWTTFEREKNSKITKLILDGLIKGSKLVTKAEMEGSTQLELEYLSNFKKLEFINMTNSKVEGIEFLKNQKSLKTLFLDQTNVKDLEYLKTCPNLSILDLGIFKGKTNF